MAKFSSPPAGPLAAGLESDFCRCWLEVLHVFQNFTLRCCRPVEVTPRRDAVKVVPAFNFTHIRFYLFYLDRPSKRGGQPLLQLRQIAIPRDLQARLAFKPRPRSRTQVRDASAVVREAARSRGELIVERLFSAAQRVMRRCPTAPAASSSSSASIRLGTRQSE